MVHCGIQILSMTKPSQPDIQVTRENVHTFLAPLGDLTSPEAVEAKRNLVALARQDFRKTRGMIASIVKAPKVEPITETADEQTRLSYRTALAEAHLLHRFRHHADDSYSSNWITAENFRSFIGGSEADFAVVYKRILDVIFDHNDPTAINVILTADEFQQLLQIIVNSSLEILQPKDPLALRTAWEVDTAATRERSDQRAQQ